MSIAAISSQFANAVRQSAASTPSVEAAAPTRASDAREPGRRHELVAAMNQSMGVQGEQDKAAEQAVFRFAHALMRDLRTMVGEETEGPRAWGRRDWGDLSQRLTALATAAASPVEAEAPAVEVPDAPNPLTTATAAVHIMKVPSSHLLEAFVSLQRALGQQSDAGNPRDALADLAKRLAAALTPSATHEIPAGSLFDVKA